MKGNTTTALLLGCALAITGLAWSAAERSHPVRQSAHVLCPAAVGLSAASRPSPSPRSFAIAVTPTPTAEGEHNMRSPLVLKRRPLDDTITVIGTVALPPGSAPHGMAMDDEKGHVFVAFHGTDHGGHALGILDASTLTLSRIIDLGPTAQGPNGVAYDRNTGYVFVTNRQTDNLSVVDPDAGTVITEVPVEDMPNGVAVIGSLVYVANFGDDSVSLLDTTRQAITATIDGIASQPAMVTPNLEERTAYISAHGSDPGPDRVYALTGSSTNTYYDGLWGPYGLSYNPVTRQLYAAQRDAQTVAIIDVDTGSIADTLNIGPPPYVLAVNPNTNHLFVTCPDVQQVYVYDCVGNALLAQLPVGSGAEEGITVDRQTDRVYVSARDSDTVTVIQDHPTYHIAFSSDRDENMEIYHMAADGTRVTRLTYSDNIEELFPLWSPDGWWITFHTGSQDSYEVYVMEADGDKRINLSKHQTVDVGEDWAPDGKRLAFTSNRNGHNQIFIVNHDGSGLTPLTGEEEANAPRWSPDGHRIAYQAVPLGSDADVYPDIYMINADGSDKVNLTDMSTGADMSPAWSPDGQKLAFSSNRDGNWEIYVVDVETLALSRLTEDPGDDTVPLWSPDGSRIAFLSNRDGLEGPYGPKRLYTIKPDGSDLQRVTSDVSVGYSFQWSPDGTQFVFDDGSHIFLVDADGRNPRQLTSGSSRNIGPSWSPGRIR